MNTRSGKLYSMDTNSVMSPACAGRSVGPTLVPRSAQEERGHPSSRASSPAQGPLTTANTTRESLLLCIISSMLNHVRYCSVNHMLIKDVSFYKTCGVFS